jgi:hypothetical protein
VPSISLTYTAAGPIVNVRVAPSQPRQQALKDAGVELPQPTSGLFLVDTGASATVIDPTLLGPLGLAPTGSVLGHTPSTAGAPVAFDQYDVMLIIPSLSADSPAWIIPAMPAFESHLISQGIHGLIGRDVLDKAILVYNGPINLFSLAY